MEDELYDDLIESVKEAGVTVKEEVEGRIIEEYIQNENDFVLVLDNGTRLRFTGHLTIRL